MCSHLLVWVGTKDCCILSFPHTSWKLFSCGLFSFHSLLLLVSTVVWSLVLFTSLSDSSTDSLIICKSLCFNDFYQFLWFICFVFLFCFLLCFWNLFLVFLRRDNYPMHRNLISCWFGCFCSCSRFFSLQIHFNISTASIGTKVKQHL